MMNANVSVNSIVRAKKYYSWNPSTCICENGVYLKNIAASSIVVCDEILNATDTVSTNVTNNIPTNMTNTMLTNATSAALKNSMIKK